MFRNLFGKNTSKELEQAAKENYPAHEPQPKPCKEHYRVGFTTDGGTTLTLMGEGGNTMTLTMNREYCERLIRMLRASYPEKINDESSE